MKKIFLFAIVSVICTQAQSQSWSLTGNAGTNASTNFIGTTDNVAFKIRTKNVVRLTVSNAGKVGIGTTSPAFKLDVKGGSINTDSVYRIGGNTVLSLKGAGNLFAGTNSGYFNDPGIGGNNNTAAGVNALYSNTSGQDNTAVGFNALFSTNGGNFNTAAGAYSLYYNTTGSNNTAVGQNALIGNTSASENTAIGTHALWNQSFSNGGTTWISGNTAVGYEALYANNPTSISNGINNTAVGALAMLGNSTGWDNTGIGVAALYSNSTGYVNTAIGRQALFYNTIGYENVATGYKALRENTGGDMNTASGNYALFSNTSGNSNTAIGHSSLYVNSTGSGNTAIGSGAYFNSSGLNNTTCVGTGSGYGTIADNRISIGNTSVVWIGGQVGWGTYSDARIKDNIKENVPGLSFITLLRPVTYNLNIHKQNDIVYKGKEEGEWNSKYDIEKIRMTGFIAQEVEKAATESGYDFSGVEIPKDESGLYGLRYSDFVMPLVKAVQELNEELKSEVKSLKSENEKLKNDIAEIKSAIGLPPKSPDTQSLTSDFLQQNTPNPFSTETEIKFQLPAWFNAAHLVISDENGKQLRTYQLQTSAPIVMKSGELPAGVYSYSLIIDGKPVATKQMILTK